MCARATEQPRPLTHLLTNLRNSLSFYLITVQTFSVLLKCNQIIGFSSNKTETLVSDDFMGFYVEHSFMHTIN